MLLIPTKRKPTSELFVYVGTKQESKNPVEAAGLFGGDLYGVQVVEKCPGTKVIGEEDQRR